MPFSVELESRLREKSVSHFRTLSIVRFSRMRSTSSTAERIIENYMIEKKTVIFNVDLMGYNPSSRSVALAQFYLHV